MTVRRRYDCTSGDGFNLTFPVKNPSGQAVSVAGGAASLRFYRQGGPVLLEKTEADGITLEGSQAAAVFNTAEILEDDVPAVGMIFAQLRLTIGGVPKTVALLVFSIAAIAGDP